MSTIIWIVILIVALAAGIGAGYFIGYNNRKKTAEAQIGSAEAEATRLVNEAIKTADQKRKEAVLEAKDEAFKLKAEVDAQKAEADKEIKQRRAEISRQENRIDQKETALDRKTEALERKEEELKKKHEEADAHLAEVDALRAKEMERLETLAGLSQEDAREVLLHKVDEELTHEKAVRIAAYETDLKENCDNIARNLIGQAVSRCAADHCSETTVSVVPLPSDEMKGRIIGREGRNIRALETATGVDLIIDDTPEAITLSSFDQTRREVARMTLERLIGDGRIHPARIEETVEKCRHELELQMKREGERAVMELGIHGLHPDLIKLIGRLKYRTSFGQNALTHSMEVAWLAGLLAGEMGVQLSVAVNKKIGSGFFGGEGFIMQRLSGQGIFFAEFDGHVIEYELKPGQQIVVDTGHLAAMTASCHMEIQTVPGMKNKFLGGEGFFNTVITGPGHVWLQTMPLSNVAGALRPYFPSSN